MCLGMHGYNGSANVGNHCVDLQSGNFGWGDFFLGLILWLSMTCIWWKVLLKLQPMSHSLSSLEGLVGGRFSLRFSPLICNHPLWLCDWIYPMAAVCKTSESHNPNNSLTPCLAFSLCYRKELGSGTFEIGPTAC